ncbi:MAG: ATP-binding protein [Eubacteriaceae bacterium]|nr:ATP-binding protein [Eubacteriaceae bacterium]
MKKILPISTDDFPTVINGGCYFVDKSMFIAEVLGNMSESKLILRPRRFGKSLNMSMLKAFLEIGSPRELFNGLAISEQKDLCDAHQAQHPVVFLSFKDIGASDFGQALEMLATKIGREAKRLGISSFAELDVDELAIIRKLSNETATVNNVDGSIYLITDALFRHYGKKAIVLIDEYDAPINQACQMGYYDEMAGLFRGLLGQALKSNPFVEFGVLTGILHVSMANVYSGVNNISVYSALDEEYGEHFGFTEEEVAAMLSYYSLEERMADMKEYYDGYRMGSYKVYNPWSVVNACYDMILEPGAELERHWANTATNDLVQDMLKRDGLEALSSIEDLISGGTVEKMVSIMATYRDLIDTPGSEALWGMMFMAGYLTWVRRVNNHFYELRAPNLEIRDALRKDALSWAKSAMPIDKRKADELYEAMLAGNAEEAEAVINDLLENVFSASDGVAAHGSFTISQERHCHLITAVLLACSSWDVKSEAESGDGYADIVCTSKNANAAIIIEEKHSAKSDDGSLSEKAEEAIEQIIAMRHSQAAQSYKTVVAVGIAYASRMCKIAIKQLR